MNKEEHYLHHANVTRTEHLPFLTWEEFLEEKIKENEPTYDEWMALNYDFYNKTNKQSLYKNILDKMQELEAEDGRI